MVITLEGFISLEASYCKNVMMPGANSASLALVSGSLTPWTIVV